MNPLTLLQDLTQYAKEQPQAAAQAFQQLSQTHPELEKKLCLELALLFEGLGQKSEAQTYFKQAIHHQRVAPPLAWQLRADTLPPIIPESPAEIQDYQRQLSQTLSQLPDQPKPLDINTIDPYLYLWKHLNFISYLGLDPLPYRQAYGQWFHQLIAEDYQRLSHALRTSERRIGVVLNATTAADFFYSELFKYLPTQGLNFFLIFTDTKGPDVFAELLNRPRFQSIELADLSYSESIEVLRKLKLDMLFLTEANTDRLLQTLLGACRIAPIQLTSALSASSSGLPNMDIFISSKSLNTPADQVHYSEKLLLFETIPLYFKQPARPSPMTRADFGLPTQGNLYLCPHLLFKFHPEFDKVLGKILRQDAQGYLVCTTKPDAPFWRQKLLQRFETHLGDVMDKIWFLPYLTQAQFLALLQCADLILDPLYFGGGTTTYEALTLEVPILTWPGPMIYGRFTAAAYRQMGIDIPIASSHEAYIQKALTLATDKEANQNLSEQIKSKQHHFFHQQPLLSSFHTFFSNFS